MGHPSVDVFFVMKTCLRSVRGEVVHHSREERLVRLCAKVAPVGQQRKVVGWLELGLTKIVVFECFHIAGLRERTPAAVVDFHVPVGLTLGTGQLFVSKSTSLISSEQFY